MPKKSVYSAQWYILRPGTFYRIFLCSPLSPSPIISLLIQFLVGALHSPLFIRLQLCVCVRDKANELWHLLRNKKRTKKEKEREQNLREWYFAFDAILISFIRCIPLTDWCHRISIFPHSFHSFLFFAVPILRCSAFTQFAELPRNAMKRRNQCDLNAHSQSL